MMRRKVAANFARQIGLMIPPSIGIARGQNDYCNAHGNIAFFNLQNVLEKRQIFEMRK